jgi:1-acyl-sn-glycerol-3-phosphate acyltransferase
MNTTRLGRQLMRAFAWSVVAVSIIPFGRLSVRGRRHVPKGQATLMVVNHVNLFDPVYVYWASLRRLHGVGTDAALRIQVLGALSPG